MASYILKDIFGDTKRVRILEELAERWGEYLSVAEIARMADVSLKTVYNHIYELEDMGIVTSIKGRTTKYGLNQEDQRAIAIAIIEDEEYLRKTKISIEESYEIENNYSKVGQSYHELFNSNSKFETPSSVANLRLKVESK